MSFMANRYVYSIQIRDEETNELRFLFGWERWTLVWEVLVYMEYFDIPFNSQIFCMAVAALEKFYLHNTWNGPRVRTYFTMLESIAESYTKRRKNAHTDNSMIKLLFMVGKKDKALGLLQDRIALFNQEGQENNKKHIHLLYQAALDMSMYYGNFQDARMIENLA